MSAASKKRAPTKLTIEPTTRCNFSCAMCVKQVPGNEIENGDLSAATINQLKPILGG
ncbi:MAG: radical SAM protein, partial [SAR324 cluster bacterium]|nr:radical SAM protein [SAR324 cluster bacterium]